MLPKLSSVFRRLANHGLYATLAHAKQRSRYQLNELISNYAKKYHRLDCFDHIPLDSLGIRNKDYVSHEPTDYLTFREFMRRTMPSKNDVFLDLGSGLGWAIIMAARYPFSAVIGVEVCPVLQSTAEHNVNRIRHKLVCPDIRLVTKDAAQYDIPPEVTHVYLYNPFGGATLRSVLLNLHRSLLKHPRDCFLMIKNSINFEREFPTCSWLREEAQFESHSMDMNKCLILRPVSTCFDRAPVPQRRVTG